MIKHMALCLAAGLAGSIGFAQETTAPNVTAAQTTATLSEVTTGAATQAGDGASTMSAMMAKSFADEKLQIRWKAEEKLYHDAGIPEDKIKKLYDLNFATWEAMASGEKTDYQGYVRERNAILTAEETQKLRATQLKGIAKRVKERDQSTSASEM